MARGGFVMRRGGSRSLALGPSADPDAARCRPVAGKALNMFHIIKWEGTCCGRVPRVQGMYNRDIAIVFEGGGRCRRLGPWSLVVVHMASAGNIALYVVVFIGGGFVALFTFDVLMRALETHWYFQPFALGAAAARQIVNFGEWCGIKLAHVYTWASEHLDRLLERLKPALKASLLDVWATLTVVFSTLWAFLVGLFTTLMETRVMQYLISPWVLFFVSMLGLALLGVLFWERLKALAIVSGAFAVGAALWRSWTGVEVAVLSQPEQPDDPHHSREEEVARTASGSRRRRGRDED